MKIEINHHANQLCTFAIEHASKLRIETSCSESGARIIDFGCRTLGGIEAGLLLAKICMGGAAEIGLSAANEALWSGPQVEVRTELPSIACMGAQYAGWPIQLDKFFAMGSGPMRTKRGKEHVLEALHFHDESPCAVGVLETDKLPNDAVCSMIAEACHVAPSELVLCVAPTRSLAGTIQVVARSIETCLHKMFELKFDLEQIVSAHGTAPLAPPARDFAEGIGRTNDAILYGGDVTLWLDCDDELLAELGPRIPSRTSSDWGQPFAQIFKKYDFDFYKVDPSLFSPARVSLVNLRSGTYRRFGELRSDVLQASFQ